MHQYAYQYDIKRTPQQALLRITGPLTPGNSQPTGLPISSSFVRKEAALEPATGDDLVTHTTPTRHVPTMLIPTIYPGRAGTAGETIFYKGCHIIRTNPHATMDTLRAPFVNGGKGCSNSYIDYTLEKVREKFIFGTPEHGRNTRLPLCFQKESAESCLRAISRYLPFNQVIYNPKVYRDLYRATQRYIKDGHDIRSLDSESAPAFFQDLLGYLSEEDRARVSTVFTKPSGYVIEPLPQGRYIIWHNPLDPTFNHPLLVNPADQAPAMNAETTVLKRQREDRDGETGMKRPAPTSPISAGRPTGTTMDRAGAETKHVAPTTEEATEELAGLSMSLSDFIQMPFPAVPPLPIDVALTQEAIPGADCVSSDPFAFEGAHPHRADGAESPGTGGAQWFPQAIHLAPLPQELVPGSAHERHQVAAPVRIDFAGAPSASQADGGWPNQELWDFPGSCTTSNPDAGDRSPVLRLGTNAPWMSSAALTTLFDGDEFLFSEPTYLPRDPI